MEHIKFIEHAKHFVLQAGLLEHDKYNNKKLEQELNDLADNFFIAHMDRNLEQYRDYKSVKKYGRQEAVYSPQVIKNIQRGPITSATLKLARREKLEMLSKDLSTILKIENQDLSVILTNHTDNNAPVNYNPEIDEQVDTILDLSQMLKAEDLSNILDVSLSVLLEEKPSSDQNQFHEHSIEEQDKSTIFNLSQIMTEDLSKKRNSIFKIMGLCGIIVGFVTTLFFFKKTKTS